MTLGFFSLDTCLPCEHASLILAAIFHKEAGGILGVTRRMVPCDFDILADLEAVAVVDLGEGISATGKYIITGDYEHLLSKSSYFRRASVYGHTRELLLELLIATSMITMRRELAIKQALRSGMLPTRDDELL